MNAQGLRFLRLAMISLGALMLAGCVFAPMMPRSDAYEYRYRVLQAGRPLPSTMHAPLPIKTIAETTLPAGSLNHAMDQLASENFKLNSLERIPDTDFYVFKFRRPIVDGYRPTRAPMEFTGVYRPATSGRLPVYYVLTPRFTGYNVTIFGRGETPLQIKAEWDGKMLFAREGQTDYTFAMTGDGRSIAAIEDTTAQGELQRSVLSLVRMDK